MADMILIFALGFGYGYAVHIGLRCNDHSCDERPT